MNKYIPFPYLSLVSPAEISQETRCRL